MKYTILVGLLLSIAEEDVMLSSLSSKAELQSPPVIPHTLSTISYTTHSEVLVLGWLI
jgi:predicted Ser/Thr protein kinase